MQGCPMTLTPATRCAIAIGVWSARLLGLAVMIVAVGEAANLGVCLLEERRS
jgi:hypothetical protein